MWTFFFAREDLDAAKRAMEGAGFVHRRSAGMEVFLDGPDAKMRDAVHIVFANEKVRPHEPASNPDVSESEAAEQFRVLSPGALVRIKLTAFRDKDKVHIRDLIGVGLVDATWPARLPDRNCGQDCSRCWTRLRDRIVAVNSAAASLFVMRGGMIPSGRSLKVGQTIAAGGKAG